MNRTHRVERGESYITRCGEGGIVLIEWRGVNRTHHKEWRGVNRTHHKEWRGVNRTHRVERGESYS